MRIATESDLPAIVAIYNEAVPTRQSTADTEAVTVESRREWFRQHAPGRRPLWVHEEDGRVVAWVGFQDFHARPAYRHTAEISLYVSSAHRGRGHGRALLAAALERAPALGIRSVVALVFAHNAPSARLFAAAGFAPWGLLPDVADMDGVRYSLAILGRGV